MNRLKTRNLFECKTAYVIPLFESCQYPWEMIPKIRDYIMSLIFRGIPGYRQISDMVLAGENVEIHPSSVIMPYTIIGDGTKVRPGAYIRGNVITGSNCIIGNSTEIKNSILLDNVALPHYNYAGDSVLGNFVHLGAGAVCSNLKSDKRNIVIHYEHPIQTGLQKLGAIISDAADIGCHTVLNPGTVVGKGTRVYPLSSLRGVYPPDSIVKSANNVVKIRDEQ